MSAILFYTTWPDEETAARCAKALVEARLAACANILSGRSIYRWDNAVHEGPEAVMLIKTSAGKAEIVRLRILELHPYATPCILALDLSEKDSFPAFLNWVSAETA